MTHKKIKYKSGDMPFSIYERPCFWGTSEYPGDAFVNLKCLSIIGEDAAPSTEGSFLEIVSPTGLNWNPGTTNFTVSIWFNLPPTAPPTSLLVSKWDMSANPAQYAIYMNVGTLRARCGLNVITTGADYRDNKWHHAVISCEGADASPGYWFYVDGELIGSTTATSTTVGVASPMVGAGDSAGNGYQIATGLFDEISFWDSYFIADDVAALYNNGVPTDLTTHSEYANLATWLRMGDGAGDALPTIVDQGPDGNDATLKTRGTPPGPASLILLPCDNSMNVSPTPGYEFTNLHEDTYGGIKDAPLQGPFTYQYVGGNQHRHVPLNKGSDNVANRPELFNISLNSSGEIIVTNPANSYLTPMESAEVVVAGTTLIKGIALDIVAGKIYWSDETDNDIKRADLTDGGNEEVIASSLSNPRGIALDIAASKIYYVDQGTEKIMRVNMSVGATPEELIDLSSEATTLESIALDIDANKMYWTDRGTDTIRRANMEVGATVEDLITSGYSFPFGIRLDISAGKMYWADFSVGISRADLDGDNVEILMEVGNPYGIALDVSAGKMYWTDYTDQVVRRSGLDGDRVETLIAPTTTEPSLGIALDVNAGKMYWGENSTEDNIKRANMSPYFPAPPVPYTRGEVAKRPVNIANHKTYNPIGNFTYDYETIQTVGRTSNNRSFVEAEGVGFIGDPNLPYSGSLVTQFVRPTSPFCPSWVLDPAHDGYENKKCLSIDGGGTSTDGSYLVISSPFSGLNWTPNTTDFTISAWFKCDAGQAGGYIVTKGDASIPTFQYAIGVDASVGVFGYAGSVTSTTTGAGTLMDGEWHHVVLSNEGSGDASLYIDGSLHSTVVNGAQTTGKEPTIGMMWFAAGPSGMFEGTIDEVSYWDAEFSAANVMELYNAGKPTNLTGHSEFANLATWLRMGDGTGDTLATIIDQGPDGNDATLVDVGTPATPASLQELTCQSDSIIAGTYVNIRPYTQNYAPDRTLPVFTPQETVFVNRFNAPGGPDVSSRGVLDTYAEEYAPNNAMPWRNNAVRSVLRTDLARHTPKATDADPVPTWHVEGFEQPTPSASHGDADLMWYGNYNSSLKWFNGAQVPRPPVTGTLSAPYGFLRRQGPVSTANTGPAGAAVGTHYAYAESSMGNASYWGPQGIGGPNIFYAISSSIGSGLLSQMSFSYFMYGANMDTPGMEAFLNVSASLDGVTWNNLELDANGVSTYNIVGQQQTSIYDSWRQAIVHLGAYAGKPNVWVKIVARTGDGTYSDIAIDQIVLMTNVEQCPTHFPTKYHTDNRNTRYYKQTPASSSIQTVVADPLGGAAIYSIAVDPIGKRVYFTSNATEGIARKPLDTPGTAGTETVYTGAASTAIRGIALDLCARKVYWTDNDNTLGESIKRINMDGTGPVETVVSTMVGTNPYGIALDVPKGMLYWVDYSNNTLFRSPMDELGATATTVLASGLNGPVGVTVESDSGKLYINQYDDKNILKANLDGTDLETVIPEQVHAIWAPTVIDNNLGKIYWVLYHSGDESPIYRANLDGTDIEEVLPGGIAVQARGLAMDSEEGKMYWAGNSSATGKAIYRANIPEKPLYDNGYVTHAIPQCSLQYAWIKASAITNRTELLGYQTSGSY